MYGLLGWRSNDFPWKAALGTRGITAYRGRSSNRIGTLQGTRATSGTVSLEGRVAPRDGAGRGWTPGDITPSLEKR